MNYERFLYSSDVLPDSNYESFVQLSCCKETFIAAFCALPNIHVFRLNFSSTTSNFHLIQSQLQFIKHFTADIISSLSKTFDIAFIVCQKNANALATCKAALKRDLKLKYSRLLLNFAYPNDC